MTTRLDLEQTLLRNPFDAELRRQYAEILLSDGEHDAALAQFELLCQQNPQAAPAHVGAARALLASGQRTEALTRYAKARQLAGFEAHEELDRIESQARRSSQPA